MRKMIILLAMLAMAAFAAIPAVAHESAGDNSNVCVGVQDVVNTGDAINDVTVDLGLGATEDGADNDLDGFIDELDEDFFGDLTADEFVEVLDALEDFNEASGEDTSIEELELEIGGASVDVSPSNSTNCDQGVYQNAEAYSNY